VWKVLCEDFFSQFVDPNDTVLDLDAGCCEFINTIQAANRITVDANPELATAYLSGSVASNYQKGEAEDVGCVAPRLHTSSMRPRRALPDGCLVSQLMADLLLLLLAVALLAAEWTLRRRSGHA